MLKLIVVAVNFAKAIPRSEVANFKSFMPECYPTDTVSKGYGLLGHVKKVPITNMTKMLPRKSRFPSRDRQNKNGLAQKSEKGKTGELKHAKSANKL